MSEEQPTQDEKSLLDLLRKNAISLPELQTILRSSQTATTHNHDIVPYSEYVKGRKVKVGVISDTHIGHGEFRPGLLEHASKVFKRDKVQMVLHAGDILEGMSGRDGHVYELSQIGFEAQISYAADLFKTLFPDLPILGINGNHDLWYAGKNNGGVNVSRELEVRLPNYTHLGDSEGNLDLGDNVQVRLFHPNDGTAYATSYKLQKLIESYEGGKKPSIVIEGHYHKALYAFIRNVHGFEAGTLCGQTAFMRGKKIPAHMGFWTLGIEKGRSKKGGVGSLDAKFYPAYD